MSQAIVMAAAVLLQASSLVGVGPWCSQTASARAEAVARRLEPWRDPPPPPSHVHTEHTLPGDPVREASVAAERALPQMRDAALAWRGGAGDVWFERARAALNAWTEVYKPDFNPIDETGFDSLIETYGMIGDHLPPAERDAARNFLIAWAQGYVAASDTARNDAKRSGGVWTNNWQSHRVKLVAMIAVATGDRRTISAARRLFLQQIGDNIAADGEVIDFRERDALHYVVYDLEPLLQAALAGRALGEDWYRLASPEGGSLEAAVRWLEPYADGRRPHQEFVRSHVAFDAQRAAAGVKGYAGPFDPHGAARLFWLAARFDPAYAALASRLGPQPPVLALCGQ